jgi:hypothetical protein
VSRGALISTTDSTPTTTASTTTSTTKRKPKVTIRNRILLMQAETIVFVQIIDVDDNQVSEKSLQFICSSVKGEPFYTF